MTILLFGATGQIGWHLARMLPGLGTTHVAGREAIDLASPDSVREAIRAARPRIIVNAAAYTDVDRAESERELAHAVNVEAPGVMADEARRSGALLVHYSTAFVFDGMSAAPYVESDEPNPINEYGRSKLAGERAIAASGARHLILRTNWVYDARRRNFVSTLLSLAAERDELRVVDDQSGAPTWARAIAEATVAMLRDAGRAEPASGIYNLTALGSTTRYDFARRLFERVASHFSRPMPRLVRVSSAEFATPAVRPANTVLEMRKFVETCGVRVQAWEAQLAAFVATLGTEPSTGIAAAGS